MARTLYAGRPGDTVAALYALGERYVYALPADANGDPTAVVLTVWDEPDGTQYTDLLAADGTTPITEVVVPPASVQIPAFYGPDGVTSELWLRDPDGDYTRLDIGPEGPAGAPGEVTTAAMNAAIAAAVAALLDSAPGALDTLNELAAALGDDPNFATTVTNALAGKVPTTRSVSAGTLLTGGGALSADRTLAVDTSALDERTRDTIGTALVAGSGVTITVNDAGDIITIAASGSGGGGGLLTSVFYRPTSGVTIAPTAGSSPVDVDATNLAVTFTAPASGTVVVVLEALIKPGSTGADSYWSLRSGSTDITNSERLLMSDSTAKQRCRVGIRVTGLTPGNSYTYKWAHRSTSAATTFYAGPNAEFTVANRYGPATMEVWSA